MYHDGDLDKAPRLSISIVIWILSSDTDTICQLNQFQPTNQPNSEAVMLPRAFQLLEYQMVWCEWQI